MRISFTDEGREDLARTVGQAFRPGPSHQALRCSSTLARLAAPSFSPADRPCLFRLWTLKWVEQPENIPTALAVVPNRLEQGVLALIKKSKCSSWK